jgi:HEAT repeat protein
MKPIYRLSAFFLIQIGLILGGSAVAAEKDPLPGDVPSLIKMLELKDVHIRASAVDRLGKMGEKAAPAVPTLIGLLNDETWVEFFIPLQSHASDALKRIGPSSIPGLIGALDDPDAQIRVWAAGTLATLQAPEKAAVPALIKALKDSHANVRTHAVVVLGNIGKASQPALPLLASMLHDDPDFGVRQDVIAALARLDGKGKKAIPAIIQALQDKEPSVRSIAAQWLGEYGPRAESAVPDLYQGLDDTGTWNLPVSDFSLIRYVRGDMAEALGKIGPEAVPALPKLRQMLESDEEGEMRAAAALAILRIDPQNKEALPKLIGLMRDGRNGTGGPEAALNAVRELGRRAKSARPAVEEALRREDSSIRGDAAEALVAIAGKDALPALLDQFAKEGENAHKPHAPEDNPDPTGDARWQILDAIGKLGADAAPAVSMLSSILKDPREGLLWDDAVKTLGEIGPAAKSAVPQLIHLLEEEDWQQQRIVETLGRIGPSAKPAVPRLLKLRESASDEEEKKEISDAIRRIDPGALTAPSNR